MDTKLDVLLAQMSLKKVLISYHESKLKNESTFTHDELRIYFSFIFTGLVIVVTH